MLMITWNADKRTDDLGGSFDTFWDWGVYRVSTLGL